MTRVAAFVLVILVAGCGSPAIDQSAKALGEALIDASVSGEALSLANSTSFPAVVRFGPSLPQKLASMRPLLSSGCSVEMIPKAAAIGSFWDTHHLYFVCSNRRVLGIRLRYSSRLEKFHVRGYWTPRSL